jgi:hypothetical protein
MTKAQLDLFTTALIRLAEHHDSNVRMLGKQLAIAMDMQDVLKVEEHLASLDQMRAFA